MTNLEITDKEIEPGIEVQYFCCVEKIKEPDACCPKRAAPHDRCIFFRSRFFSPGVNNKTESAQHKSSDKVYKGVDVHSSKRQHDNISINHYSLKNSVL